MISDEMDYNESLVYKEVSENSERLADDIMTTIRRLGLDINFTMDGLTPKEVVQEFKRAVKQREKMEAKHN